MQTSARNVFLGTVKAVRKGAINDEVELSVEGEKTIVAAITRTSRERLGLKEGMQAAALIKADFVLLMTDADDYLLSTRNQFKGKVAKITKGTVNAEVQVALPDDSLITSVITVNSVDRLGLALGSPVTAIVKAMNVIVAVPKQ
ncbi:MAG: TOBE domain-containing protein [Desulfovibrio sp.]|nr:TOBE domain-containing protein [Desulfovibrio sp.]